MLLHFAWSNFVDAPQTVSPDLANCVPEAIFGGFGSDLPYTGHDNVFIAAADRGPFDGLTDVPYLDRFHFLHITTDVGAPFPNIHTVLLETQLLKNELNQTLPVGVVPVSKTLFIELLVPVFNLSSTIAEKIEGLAWGPDLHYLCNAGARLLNDSSPIVESYRSRRGPNDCAG